MIWVIWNKGLDFKKFWKLVKKYITMLLPLCLVCWVSWAIMGQLGGSEEGELKVRLGELGYVRTCENELQHMRTNTHVIYEC